MLGSLAIHFNQITACLCEITMSVGLLVPFAAIEIISLANSDQPTMYLDKIIISLGHLFPLLAILTKLQCVLLKLPSLLVVPC